MNHLRNASSSNPVYTAIPNTIVYNNFPWPEPADKQQKTIETIAQGILDARAKFPDSTLAKLYNPVTMPPELVAAHRKLDKAVDAAYGKKSFVSEAERVAFLFERYQQLVNRPQPAKETTNAKDSV
ncbi:MAG: type IIL restriction-modification enzyme MmeI [Nitrosomonas sp.]|nr:DNA methylase [Burkholderiales bacterium]